MTPTTVGVELVVNGAAMRAEVAPDETLLAVLRRNGLLGAKEACGRGECGACTVLVDGVPQMSCIAIASLTSGEVVTVEGLGEVGDVVRRAFADHAAYQCGYCTPGHVVTACALVGSGVVTTRDGLRSAISGNICRCTGYTQILDALEAARSALDEGAPT